MQNLDSIGCTFEEIDLARTRMMIEIQFFFAQATGTCSLKIDSLATTYPASLLSAPALHLKMSRILYSGFGLTVIIYSGLR